MKTKGFRLFKALPALIFVLGTMAFKPVAAKTVTTSMKTYTLASSGRIYAYTDSSLKTLKDPTKKNWYIDCPTDECRIVKATETAVQVYYPIGNGKMVSSPQWFKRSDFSAFDLTKSPSQTWKILQQVDTYRRSDLKTKYGYIGAGDTVYLLGTSGTNVQVIYPLSDGSWKLGWVNLMTLNKARLGILPAESFICPVKNYDETNHAGLNKTSWAYYSSENRSDNRHWHLGIDLKVKGESYSSRKHDLEKDKVYAFSSGTVKAVGYNSANGNYVVIQHTINGKTVYSFYGHLYKYLVKKNDKVTTNTVIGYIGWTGNCPGNGKHLHFSIVDKLWSAGSYLGYTNVNILTKKVNKTTYGGVTFYNPWYVINNKKLP